MTTNWTQHQDEGGANPRMVRELRQAGVGHVALAVMRDIGNGEEDEKPFVARIMGDGPQRTSLQAELRAETVEIAQAQADVIGGAYLHTSQQTQGATLQAEQGHTEGARMAMAVLEDLQTLKSNLGAAFMQLGQPVLDPNTQAGQWYESVFASIQGKWLSRMAGSPQTPFLRGAQGRTM